MHITYVYQGSSTKLTNRYTFFTVENCYSIVWEPFKLFITDYVIP